MTTDTALLEDEDTVDAVAKDEPRRADMARAIPEDVLDRLVYIVGSPRGGTTIIARSFFLSDRVFTFPGFTQFTRNVWHHRKKMSPSLLRRIFRLPKYYHELRILKSLDERVRRKMERDIQDAFAAKDLGRLYKIYPRLYALDPDCAKDGARALCWSDKANDIIGLFDIARSMPKARFIFIIRDPRATIASMRGQIVMSRGEEDRPSARAAGLINSAIYWRNMMQTFLRFARRYPERTMFVRYEDFVDDPEETINRLLEFGAGERMSGEALSAGFAHFKHGRKHDRSATGFGIDSRPVDRWRRMLSEEEVYLVAALTARTGRKLGYDIGSAGIAPVVKALRRIESRRTRAVTAAKLAYLGARALIVPRRADTMSGNAVSGPSAAAR